MEKYKQNSASESSLLQANAIYIYISTRFDEQVKWMKVTVQAQTQQSTRTREHCRFHGAHMATNAEGSDKDL